ncbi:PREDICTED: 28 kDa ribonucleoprotein, chloroplastic [Prunus mume]|uniref:28 kDa ribonucleoprotein, chloroplastic n=1 Tax=Prunus mume TaxID=102107 RepID=A0ABM0N4C2_PRUMU|nr:PREDICTED: 28 kDa ribonucleoprotein, chloroplastic [Prunus mume]
MALLRYPCFLTEQVVHLTPLLSLQNPQHLSKHTPTTLSLSGSLSSLSLSLPHTHTRSSSITRTKRLSNFVFQFSSTAQEQALDESPVLESEPEEFSDTRLLAQNVPWTCTPEDIRTLFEKYGTVVDVELAMYNKTRNRGLAFVTMGSPEEALAALNNLESSEMEGRIIKMAYAKPKKTKIPPPSSQPKPVTFNLYVENLPYEARSKDLKELFNSEDCSVVTAEVVFQGNPRRSAGYGFVGFKSKKEAEAALSAFHGKLLMGRRIRVARGKQFVKVPKEESSQLGDESTELNSTVEQVNTDVNDTK